MNCPQCGRSIPADAQFCIFCRARVAPQAGDKASRPVTGPTVRLDQDTTPPVARPLPVSPPVQPFVPGTRRSHGSGRRGHGVGIFPLGLLILFFTGWWWPGILVLLGFTALADGFGRGRGRSAIQTMIFFLVLALLFSGHGLSHAVWLFSPFWLVLCMMLPMSIWWFGRH